MIVFGSLNIDYNILVTNFPKPGETVLGKRYQKSPGGKGANQAIAASRFGAETLMFGKLGTESNSLIIKESLKKNGVNISCLGHTEDVDSGTAFIFLADDGENNITVIPGANGEFLLNAQSKKDIFNILKPGDIVVAQLEIPMESVMEIGKIANEKGNAFILNAAPASRLPAQLMESVNLLVVNESELATIMEREMATLEEIKESCMEICNKDRNVIATLGSKGCVVATHNGVKHIEAIQVDVVDTTGAGDAFVAGLAAMLAENKSLDYAVLFSIVAGGLTTTKVGAQTGIPSREDVLIVVDKILKERGEI